MLNKEDKQNVAKVKKLIRTRDLEKIEMGIELVRSINNPYIFDELLGNVEYSFDQWSGTFKYLKLKGRKVAYTLMKNYSYMRNIYQISQI